MTSQEEETIHDEYDVGQEDIDQSFEIEPNPPVQCLELESSAHCDAILDNMASATAIQDPLETAGHSGELEPEESIEWLEFESGAVGGAPSSALDSCARQYHAEHERLEQIEPFDIQDSVDDGEAVSIKEENFNMARLGTSLESTNTSDCVIVLEYQEAKEEVDDTDAE